MKPKRLLLPAVLLVAVTMVLASCAQSESVDACLTGHKYGFLGGVLHGFLAPLEFIAMLFSDKYAVYAQNNNGNWYAFGFLIGSSGWGFLAGKGKG